MMKTFASIIGFIVWSSIVAAQPVDLRTSQLCTADINPFGVPSICACPEGQHYDQTTGGCAEALNAFVILNTSSSEGIDSDTGAIIDRIVGSAVSAFLVTSYNVNHLGEDGGYILCAEFFPEPEQIEQYSRWLGLVATQSSQVSLYNAAACVGQMPIELF